MKKLLMGAIVLSFFAIAISLFQMSCQKDSNAQTSNYVLPPATTTTLGGVIVGSGLSVTNVGVLSTSGGSATQLNKLIFKKAYSSPLHSEIWICNYDGTGAAKVNITLPNGMSFADGMTPALSPNGQKIFFSVAPTGSITSDALYSCNADGTNVTKIVDSFGGTIDLGGAY